MKRAPKKRTALQEAAAEQRAVVNARTKVGAGLAGLMTEAELVALVPGRLAGTAGREQIALAAVQVLRAHCARMAEAKALAGERRVPIVGEKFAGVLARMLFQQVDWSHPDRATGLPWALVFRSTLEVAYEQGTVEGRQLQLSETHPGSKAGAIIADLRDRTAYADQSGKVSFESVLARVKGDPKPKGR